MSCSDDVIASASDRAMLEGAAISPTDQAGLQTSMGNLMRPLALALDLAVYEGSGSCN